MTTRLLGAGVEAGILGILLLSPVPFGSVLPWAQAGIQALVAVTVAMWVIRMLAGGELAVRVNPLIWPGIAMLVVIGAQLVVPGRSVTPYFTWEALRLYAVYLAFLVVVSSHLVTPRRIVRLVSVLVTWGVVLAALGLVSRVLGHGLLVGGAYEGYRGRLVSTFVNPNHQALYFTVLLFLALGMVLRPARRSRAAAPGAGKATVETSMSGAGPVARILFGAAALVLAVALVLTGSRGGVVAAIGAVLALGAVAIAGRVRSRIVIGLAASLAAFVGYIAWVGADVLLDRLTILAREPFGDLRWELWRSTLQIAAGAPILGVGFGTFEDAIIAHRPAGLLDSRFVEYAHNDYLQLLAEGGLVSVLILCWAAVVWFAFVIGRWRDRQDPFVRGLVLGGLGAVAAVVLQSVVDFGLHMPANALLVVAVLALLPAVVTLRAHRAGLQVDLREWRRPVGLRPRVAVGVATAVVTLVVVLGLASVGIADWKYRDASRVLDRVRRAQAAVTAADFSRAGRELWTAARLDPWNPRIQTALADVSAELGDRAWTFGLTPEGRRMRPGTLRERLVASQPLFGTAHAAFERSLKAQPLAALTHARFGWFLSRLDSVRLTVQAEGLRAVVEPGVTELLGTDESLLPEGLRHLQRAVQLDPESAERRLAVVAYALTHHPGIPTARAIAIKESQEALRLEPRVLPKVVELLITQTHDVDLLWRAVPRDAAVLVDLASILENRTRVSAAAAALEDAVAVSAGGPQQVPVLVARSRFLLRHKGAPLALSLARQALTLAPQDAEVFGLLAEAYEANGLLDQAITAAGSAVAKAGEAEPRRVNQHRARLATLLAGRGDLADALILRRQIVRATPNDAGPRLELARMLEARRDIAEALREYEVARELGQGEWWVQRMVADAFLRHGLLREAAVAAEQAIRLNPADDDLRIDLGHLYARIGLPDRAREQYQTVLARQPGHDAASRGLRAVSAPQGQGAGGG